MAVNHYFQGGQGIGNDSEKKLFENLIIEGLQIYGFDVYYLPRTLVNRDIILGEDTLSKFDDSYMIEMYMESNEGFAGEQELISKFGLEIREDTTFTLAKRRWDDAVDSYHTMIVEGRPNEGDILYVPLMNSFFEISFVEDQEPFFQLGQLPVYQLKVTRWEYSSEKIDTGITEIDSAEDQYSLDQLHFQVELEEGTLDDSTTSYLLLENDSADGRKQYFIDESYDLQTQSKYADNNDLDSEAGFDTASAADDILDFTERNPFGEVDL
jgi:hypothetical protein